MMKAIFSLLSVAHHKKSLRIVGLIILRSLLDFAGVTTVLSLLLLLLNQEGQAVGGMVLVGGVLVIALKSILTIWIDTYCSDWYLSLYRYYSANLLSRYYRRGLQFIKSKGSATLTYEVNSICYAFVMNVLSPAFQMIGKMVLVLLLFIAFGVYSPCVALVFLCSTVLITWFYAGVIQNRIMGYGEEENRAKKRQWRNVQELFLGYMDIETNQAFRLLNTRFEEEMECISFCRKKIRQVQQVPPALLETGMTLALLSLFLMAQTHRELVLLLGIFAVAGMRIIPSIHSMISCWTQIRNHRYAVDVIAESMHDGLVHVKEVDEEPVKLVFNHSLEVDRISFSYSEEESFVLNNFSMKLACGECVGIQGASGIGKSTLVNLLLGFYQPMGGQIRIDGISLSVSNRRAWHQLVGYVPQEVFIVDGTLAENIALGIEKPYIDTERIKMVLKQMNLDKWASELPLGIDTFLGENGNRMSGGERQRIGIARTLYKGAKVLFFDEATSALDPQTEEDILQLIRELPDHGYQVTLLMIAHRESSLSKCDRIVRI